MAERDIPRDLGDGLILRRSTIADREAVAAFHARYLFEPGEEPPVERVYYWISDGMSGEHPGFDPRDFTIVEEAATGKIVSSIGLISVTWTYDGMPIKVGQPDAVSTDPAYRRRGLVREQMAVIHDWSAARGELVQAITGIPWYYRQFGYELALNLGGHRTAYRPNVPKLGEGEAEPMCFRPATGDDLPFIMAMYGQMTERSLVACRRDEALWRFDLEQRHPKNGLAGEFRVMARCDGEDTPVGLLIYPRVLWGARLGVRLCEVVPGVPWLAVAPSILRYLDAVGETYATHDGGAYEAIEFHLGETHPLYDTVPRRLPDIVRPYAWYLRVPNVVAFMRQIAPALERRLAASAQAGFSGALTISFYRDGIRLRCDEGAIAVERWMPEEIEADDAAFVNHTFLQLLFGFRSLAEIEAAFPDSAAITDEARVLLPILFPKKSSTVWTGG